ncbi:Sip1-related alpha-galactosidase [Cohnella sp. GCM10027633]|uniref:Sip1-related alpha-galactosidase n=1 Tax=unclassified Cohnella TaxID=2636738 RepID=UPI003626007F
MELLDKGGGWLELRKDGGQALPAFRPSLAYEDGVQPPLELVGIVSSALTDGEARGLGEGLAYEASYADAEGHARLKLTLRCYADTLLVHAEAEVTQDPFGVSNRLAPKDGILLRVSEPEGGGRAMSSYHFYKSWWTRPHFGDRFADVPDKTQSMLWQAAGSSSYVQWTTVSAEREKTTLRGDGSDKDGGLIVAVSPNRIGGRRVSSLLLAGAIGNDPFALPERVASVGYLGLGRQAMLRRERTYPPMFDKLGWCSWDAFYHAVSEQGLIDKAEEFKALGLPVGWFMIDDGWMDVKDRQLVSFGTDRTKFPGGLAPAVRRLKEQYGIGEVGVWHTMNGYWYGIDPDSELAVRFRGQLLATGTDRLIPHPEPEKGYAFWRAWHAELQREGIDLVKVDSQSSLGDLLGSAYPVGEASAGTHEALEASVATHFQGRIINCMGMAEENLWARPYSAINRNSDDYFPKRAGSFREHALQNAYNSLYHGAFHWGDWDMWWTRNDDALASGVLRAVSGGPLYVSDGVGATDPARLWPLLLRDGTVLRCDQPGLPTEDGLFVDPNTAPVPLKVWNRVGKSGVVAAFHIGFDEGDVTGQLRAGDVPGLEGDRFAVYETLSGVGCWLGGDGEELPLRLASGETRMYAIVPAASDGFAAIGLSGKHVAPATIAWQAGDADRRIVKLREGGSFVFMRSTAPSRVTVDGAEAQWSPGEGTDAYIVDCASAQGEPIIEIYN